MRKRQEVVKRLAARSLRKTWSACDSYIAPSARPSVYLQKWNCELEITPLCQASFRISFPKLNDSAKLAHRFAVQRGDGNGPRIGGLAARFTTRAKRGIQRLRFARQEMDSLMRIYVKARDSTETCQGPHDDGVPADSCRNRDRRVRDL